MEGLEGFADGLRTRSSYGPCPSECKGFWVDTRPDSLLRRCPSAGQPIAAGQPMAFLSESLTRTPSGICDIMWHVSI